MAYKQINWKNKRLTKFTGRNGYYNCSGMNFFPMSNGDCIMIAPVTSKGSTGRCDIEIPIESIDEVINALKQLKK